MNTAKGDPAEWASGVLGQTRAGKLAQLAQRIDALAVLTDDAWSVDFIVMPLDGAGMRRLQRLSDADTWAVMQSADGATFHAVDEVSPEGEADTMAALVYPEKHTQLVSWWLTHAWRFVDLTDDAIGALRRWRIASAAVTARALIEAAGCLLVESRKLADAWGTAKALPSHPIQRPLGVRDLLHHELGRALLASRLDGVPQTAWATNVQTYVDKLARWTGESRFKRWYDWLSDAAHPAYGAHSTYSSPPMVHESRAVTIRWYARSPLVLHNANGAVTELGNHTAECAADAALAASTVAVEVLDQALLLVDDFGLTTEAARLTNRRYWRNFNPVRGSRKCPCGRSSAATCEHRWGHPAPAIVTPTGGPTWPDGPGADRCSAIGAAE